MAKDVEDEEDDIDDDDDNGNFFPIKFLASVEDQC